VSHIASRERLSASIRPQVKQSVARLRLNGRLRSADRDPAHAIATQKELVLQVLVRDNNVDQALRVLKKKMQREGVFREMKRRRFYEKPSTRATREKGEAVRRARKATRKQAIREGLIAAPPKKKFESRQARAGGLPRHGSAGARTPSRAEAR
jgi:small subunit ribosomal protein S21